MSALSKFLLTYLTDEKEEELTEIEAYSYEQAMYLSEQQCSADNIISVERSVCHSMF